MDSREVGQYWERNAATWTKLVRAGYDVYRDLLNTPAFLAMLPDVRGLRGLDIGCGEGANTRQVAGLGASMVGVDISPTFIRHADEAERDQPRGIRYQVADATALPFDDASFDFATAFMSIMDVPDSQGALREAFRVLKPDGFLQFSITHPCFDTPHRRNLRDEAGITYAVEVGRYFEAGLERVDRWTFGSIPREQRDQYPPFEVPRFHRTLSDWVNLTLDTGFVLERMVEPRVDDATAAAQPTVQDAQVVAYFLHVRVRKP